MKNKTSSSLTEKLRSIARTHDADIYGVASVKNFMDYSGKRSPSYYLKDSQSVIVIGMHLYDPFLDAWIRSAGDKKDYYVVNEILAGSAHALIHRLLADGHQAVLSPYSGVFSKEAGALARLGVIGKNNLLITPQYGPRVRLRTVITDAHLSLPKRKPKDHCADCSRYCWSACPAQAFRSGLYDRNLCEEYSEMSVQRLSENATLFCRECERACPVGMASKSAGQDFRMPFQVLVFPYYIEKNRSILYALFRRPQTAGGYWQAIAGGVLQGESVLMAARREAHEEAGITSHGRLVMLRSNASIPVTSITGEFTWGRDVFTAQEYSFGVQVTDKNLWLSEEHVEYRWVDYDTALSLLKFDSNKHALWELNERLVREARMK